VSISEKSAFHMLCCYFNRLTPYFSHDIADPQTEHLYEVANFEKFRVAMK
jgi:hypothetical protein